MTESEKTGRSSKYTTECLYCFLGLLILGQFWTYWVYRIKFSRAEEASRQTGTSDLNSPLSHGERIGLSGDAVRETHSVKPIKLDELGDILKDVSSPW